MFLIFDTETTGFPKRWDAPITQLDNWPRVVQIAWQLHDEWGNLLEHQGIIIYPDDWEVPYDAERVHGISTELARRVGKPALEVYQKFLDVLAKADVIAGHNLQFDINVIASELYRYGFNYELLTSKKRLDTCDEATALLTKLPGGKGGKFKFPNLTELYTYLFGETFAEAHNATADVEATARCFFELIRRKHYSELQLNKPKGYLNEFLKYKPQPFALWGLTHQSLKKASAEVSTAPVVVEPETIATVDAGKLGGFFHLFNKSRFSILSSTIEVSDLVQKAAEMNLPAVGIADTGNMMAAFQFMSKLKEINTSRPDDQKIKGIIGCELELVNDITAKAYHERNPRIVLYAKNKSGYANLSKLVSIANTEGFYYNPRIDKKHISLYKEHLIALSGTLQGEIPQLILSQGKKAAEEALLWWKEQFGDDFYIQLNRHGLEEEQHVNQIMLELAREHGVKVVATNNNFYLNPDEFELLDALICVRDGNLVSNPIGKGRGFRFGYTVNSYYFRTPDEMAELYADLPEALYNLAEIAEKVENYDLKREVLLPKFEIPDEFKDPEDEKDGGKRGENRYLRYLTYQGAKKRYPVLTDEIRERLDFELETIEKTGYPGYFLIVSDFCRAAREMGVIVGPGRGSAAGSAVAYCIGITNVDPIKYNLLFERFLNPERVSLPDIDTDFDDEGREKVIKYVMDKYGANQVAQIITYGTMAAKSSVRDCGRVLGLSPSEVNALSKKVPSSLSLSELFKIDEKDLRERLRSNELPGALEIRQLYNSDKLEGKVLRMAEKLEGALRNTGIHACGVIITPTDVRNLVPVARAKDSDMWCTQFDNNIVESAGLLKMDFLGLKTLTIIKDACRMIKKRFGIDIDPDQIPLDDPITYERIFQTGDTIGVFQLESPGMQKYLRQLRPTTFEDIIAMVALYRPGPMEYIPDFIDRKHGRKPIEYDLPEMEEYLRETYGVTVYQEQVMLLSQKLAGFTKGEADVLRKAMGKKQKAVLDKMKPKFIDQASAKGFPIDKLEKIWTDWEAFASYAFNKSHATCYAVLAVQTAYLKAHYPAEFMASTITHYQNDVKTISFYMEDCRRHKIPILGPSVNESDMNFSVNANGEIRFGLAGMKGVGEGAAQNIIEERQKGGPFKSIFDFVERVDQRTINKKVMESLALGGAFDDFSECHRATFFEGGDGKSFIETLLKYGQSFKNAMAQAQMSLFGDLMSESIQKPAIPSAEPWSTYYALQREAEINGLYLSGHPLDDYRIEFQSFANTTTAALAELENFVNQEIRVLGIVNNYILDEDRNGERTCRFELMDYEGTYTFRLRSQAYNKFGHFVQNAQVVLVTALIKPPFQRNDGQVGQPYIDITNIEPVTELSAKAQRLNIYVNPESLEEDVIASVYKTLSKNPGDKALRFIIEDDNSGISVHTLSKMKVKINRAIVYELSQIPDLKVFLN
ncbi:DNA-directed DNA polymerase [Thermaurantimonas aggregans]|uniref:DNA polymerase III subunit alpha n=1 Tax=Thermaurantimonas aggregans TaxID=2173829 RepID=A0A401XKP9_9FLAO|nr:DNA polymerase III subunit alpha [Thermaurantimonas aggregans]MCX8147910.1 DNA polymerase III subunit alpha [Thermaurantimonas aggregans]GCD77573.1 DNA-directed DNA polymerase [Thermaurantimonas aggregans]